MSLFEVAWVLLEQIADSAVTCAENLLSSDVLIECAMFALVVALIVMVCWVDQYFYFVRLATTIGLILAFFHLRTLLSRTRIDYTEIQLYHEGYCRTGKSQFGDMPARCRDLAKDLEMGVTGLFLEKVLSSVVGLFGFMDRFFLLGLVAILAVVSGWVYKSIKVTQSNNETAHKNAALNFQYGKSLIDPLRRMMSFQAKEQANPRRVHTPRKLIHSSKKTMGSRVSKTESRLSLNPEPTMTVIFSDLERREMEVQMQPSERFGRHIRAFEKTFKMKPRNARFIVNGRIIRKGDTPAAIHLEDDFIVMVDEE